MCITELIEIAEDKILCPKNVLLFWDIKVLRLLK